MEKTLLLEIGTEEIPAGFIVPALDFINRRLTQKFAEIGLNHAKPEVFGTPRRLAIRIGGLTDKLDDAVETRMGPARRVAFDENGNPSKAGLGFAKSAGVEFDDIEIVETEKGEYLSVTKTIPGGYVKDVLPGILTETIAAIPFRKTMRWSNPDVRFARPLHWIVALLGDEILPVTFGDVKAGNTSRGNRFMAKDEFVIDDPASYEALLEERYVIPSLEKRKAKAWEGLQQKAAQLGAEIRDPELLDEVINLLEYPHALLGSFDDNFLNMPPEVITTVLIHHQRNFPLYDSEGRLKPNFLTVSNIIPNDDKLVVAGNEKVVRARLDDGKHFFDEDLKVPLMEYAERHKDVIFHKDLGTSFEKVERFKHIALYLADFMASDKKDKVALAADLSKADLNSLMVYELPELQGIMGREYARKQGIDEEVALAIHEHYLPTSADDELATGVIGDIVGMADRMDTICGCFGIGQVPTGSADPYALRRQAIAIENILLGKGYRISIAALTDEALSLLAPKMTKPGAKVREDVLNFFAARFVAILQTKGIGGDVIEAVIPGFDDPVDTFMKAQALSDVKDEPWFTSICGASKRVENILKKIDTQTVVREDLFEEEAERELYNRLQELEVPFTGYVGKGEYTSALKLLVGLKDPIDSFFENVLVMSDDIAVRDNRVALLKSLVTLFDKVARFSAIDV